jgi:hypothetical protein
MMYRTENIDYYLAQSLFNDAKNKDLKLIPGKFETNIWLHNEQLNLDYIVGVAKQFPDAKIFIISRGPDKGFYIYSTLQKSCIKLVRKTYTANIAQIA